MTREKLRSMSYRVQQNLSVFDGVNPRSILVMDNASIHHADHVLEMVANAGCLLWFLPACSPDMNPIKEVFRRYFQL